MDCYFWKNMCFVLIICCIFSIGLNQVLQQDLDWHKQEVFSSWNMKGQERLMLRSQIDELQNQINELQNQLHELDKELAVCEIILKLEKENSSK